MKTVLAVDGGNSKTDVVLLDMEGRSLSRARGPGCSPDALGVGGMVEVLRPLVDSVRAQSGLGADNPASVAALLLAGVDRPEQELEVSEVLKPLGLGEDLVVSNDTFAVLLAGSSHGWGVAVVCGAGLNAVGVTEGGRVGRYQALGELSGDWGGGYAVGLAALGAAIRADDGRGPKTSMTARICDYFAVAEPQEVAAAIHEGRLDANLLVELSPLVFSCAADGDGMARGILDRVGDEVAIMAVAMLRRLEIDEGNTEVILGGGLLQSGNGDLVQRIHGRIVDAAPKSVIRVLRVPPVVGCARAGLERLSLSRDDVDEAVRRLGSSLGTQQ